MIHPYEVLHWKIKTQSKIGKMICDIVSQNNGKEELQINGITELAKKNHLHDQTFKKYLYSHIFDTDGRENFKKCLFLDKIDIILIKEIIFLEKRYELLDKKQRNLLKLLITYLGKTL